MSSFLSLVIGLFLGILLGFVRAFFNNNDIDERKKLRRTRNFFKKKSMESFRDRRITGTIMLLMLVAAPFYFGYKSQQPVFWPIFCTNDGNKFFLPDNFYFNNLSFLNHKKT